MRFKVISKSDYYDYLSPEDIERYLNKISLVHKDRVDAVREDPFQLGDGWDVEVKGWPAIEMCHIMAYFISKPGLYTLNQLQNYRSLEAFDFVLCGKVGEIGVRKVEGRDDELYLRSEVQHSQSQAKPLQVWLRTRAGGEILCAHCTCMAG